MAVMRLLASRVKATDCVIAVSIVPMTSREMHFLKRCVIAGGDPGAFVEAGKQSEIVGNNSIKLGHWCGVQGILWLGGALDGVLRLAGSIYGEGIVKELARCVCGNSFSQNSFLRMLDQTPDFSETPNGSNFSKIALPSGDKANWCLACE